MIKGVTHAHLGPIWYHSEKSDVPKSPNQFIGWDISCRFLQQDGSSKSSLGLRFLFHSERISPHCLLQVKEENTCLTFYFPLVWPENFYAITFGRDEITAELTCINKNNSLHNGYRGELIYW